MGLGVSARQKLLEDYLAKNNNKVAYEKVRERIGIMAYANAYMSMIMQCLYNRAPKETGYGRSVGIRYKQKTIYKNGRKRRLRNHFIIIVGSERGAHSGQTTPNAPYMALQNVPNPETGLGRNEGWISEALSSARNKVKEDGMLKYVRIDNPKILSRYRTKNGSSPPAGYYIDVVFLL